MFDPRLPEEIAACIVRLATDRKLRAQLVTAGRRRARAFADSNRMAREYWRLFRSAVGKQRQQSGLIGAYGDGWSGPVLNVQVAPASRAQTVEFRLSAPGWLPESVGVSAWRRGKPHGEPLTIERGSSGVFTLPVGSRGGCYEVKFTRSFVPASAGLSPDDRELSAFIDACSIVSASGERTELFPCREG
jgi:hypothetical protein